MSVGLIVMVREEGAGFEQFTSAFLKSMAAEKGRLSLLKFCVVFV